MKTAFEKPTNWTEFWKRYFICMGLVCFASLYLFVSVWVGSDYSYTGGWFIFLVGFMMPIRLKGNPLRVLYP